MATTDPTYPQQQEKDILNAVRKAVQFAPSSAMEYEAEEPVNQCLTPIPDETVAVRYPTELKPMSTEEYDMMMMTKRNHALLKACDNFYYENDDGASIRSRQSRKRPRQNRRTSFYVSSTSQDNSS
jgi:hypothetical protein